MFVVAEVYETDVIRVQLNQRATITSRGPGPTTMTDARVLLWGRDMPRLACHT